MAKFTITEFKAQYPTNEACLDKIFEWRYGKLEACPECQCKASFRRVITRRCYQCTQCYTQFYPTAGTVFEKTRTPLTHWFLVIFLFTTTRNGLAAKEIERVLGVTYKCAFRIGHQVRKLIAGLSTEQLKGLVEADETFIGGKEKNKHWNKKRHITGGHDKHIVFGALQRDGSVKAMVIEDTSTISLRRGLNEFVEKGSIVVTDDLFAYRAIKNEYFHGVVNHTMGEYGDKVIHTNSIEGYFSQIKRTIFGTHLHVTRKYLQNYVNECSFRYNHRKRPDRMFDRILENIPVITTPETPQSNN